MTNLNRKQALKKMTLSAGLLALSEVSGATDNNYKPMNTSEENSHDWKNAALIVVDMQNDFVRKGAHASCFFVLFP